MSRRAALPIVVVLATLIAASPLVAAQGPESSTTTTTSTTTTQPTGPTSSTTSSTPPTSTSTTVPATTTTVYVPPVPPELADDPRLPFLVDPGELDIPLAQTPFDPRSVVVLPERVAEATAALDAAQAFLAGLQAEVEVRSAEVTELSAQLGDYRSSVRAAVRRTAAARSALLDHAVTAYMVGDVDEKLPLVQTEDFVDLGVAKSYVSVVADAREDLVERYREARRGLDEGQEELADDLGDAQSALDRATAEIGPAFDGVVESTQALSAYEAGAQAYIGGFVFPVAGPTEFIDSWGYPRMMGTASAHWHQGTDVFALLGTPLIASENGVLRGIGTGTLGGNKLWLNGDSGNEYYYAHLSGFAEGIENGQRVAAGDVLGYVGDTGNARGTSPHLHFEIHPDGVGPVNPYPLLKAAYGTRPIARATVDTTIPPPAPATAPPTTTEPPTTPPPDE